MAEPDDRSIAGRLLSPVVSPIVESVDIDAVIQDVDIDQLLERIDINALLDRVDIEQLLERIDVNALLDRVDIEQLLERIDVDALMERVDVDALVSRVDVNEIVERTEIGDIIARSTSGVFTQLLDVVRTQIVTVDMVVQGLAAFVVRRTQDGVPPGPGLDPVPVAEPRPPAPERAIQVQGRFAGSVSRFLAFLVDQTILNVLYAGAALLFQAALQVVVGQEVSGDEARWLVMSSYVIWAFVYYSASLAATGRTFGKAILGLMVVRPDGRAIGGRTAMLRTILFPFSFLIFGVGFLIGLFRRDRRELHDLGAGTAVIYAWDATTARLRTAALAEVEPTAIT